MQQQHELQSEYLGLNACFCTLFFFCILGLNICFLCVIDPQKLGFFSFKNYQILSVPDSLFRRLGLNHR